MNHLLFVHPEARAEYEQMFLEASGSPPDDFTQRLLRTQLFSLLHTRLSTATTTAAATAATPNIARTINTILYQVALSRPEGDSFSAAEVMVALHLADSVRSGATLSPDLEQAIEHSIVQANAALALPQPQVQPQIQPQIQHPSSNELVSVTASNIFDDNSFEDTIDEDEDDEDSDHDDDDDEDIVFQHPSRQLSEAGRIPPPPPFEQRTMARSPITTTEPAESSEPSTQPILFQPPPPPPLALRVPARPPSVAVQIVKLNLKVSKSQSLVAGLHQLVSTPHVDNATIQEWCDNVHKMISEIEETVTSISTGIARLCELTPDPRSNVQSLHDAISSQTDLLVSAQNEIARQHWNDLWQAWEPLNNIAANQQHSLETLRQRYSAQLVDSQLNEPATAALATEVTPHSQHTANTHHEQHEQLQVDVATNGRSESTEVIDAPPPLLPAPTLPPPPTLSPQQQQFIFEHDDNYVPSTLQHQQEQQQRQQRSRPPIPPRPSSLLIEQARLQEQYHQPQPVPVVFPMPEPYQSRSDSPSPSVRSDISEGDPSMSINTSRSQQYSVAKVSFTYRPNVPGRLSIEVDEHLIVHPHSPPDAGPPPSEGWSYCRRISEPEFGWVNDEFLIPTDGDPGTIFSMEQHWPRRDGTGGMATVTTITTPTTISEVSEFPVDAPSENVDDFEMDFDSERYVQVKYDFNPTADTKGMPVKEGDVVQILMQHPDYNEHSEWTFVRITVSECSPAGEDGFVPTAYLNIIQADQTDQTEQTDYSNAYTDEQQQQQHQQESELGQEQEQTQEQEPEPEHEQEREQQQLSVNTDAPVFDVSPAAVRRLNAIDEVRAMERSFCERIGLLIDVLYTPLNDAGMLDDDDNISESNSSTTSVSLSPDDPTSIRSTVNDLCMHLDQMGRISTQFSSALENRNTSHETQLICSADYTIGDIFLYHYDKLYYYPNFIKSYESLMRLFKLQMVRGSDTTTASGVYTQRLEQIIQTANVQLAKCHSSLDGHLFEIARHITNYALLLSNVIGKTPPDHKDYALLKEAQVKILEVCNAANRHKKQSDRIEAFYKYRQSINFQMRHNISKNGGYIQSLDQPIVISGKNLGQRKFIDKYNVSLAGNSNISITLALFTDVLLPLVEYSSKKSGIISRLGSLFFSSNSATTTTTTAATSTTTTATTTATPANGNESRPSGSVEISQFRIYEQRQYVLTSIQVDPAKKKQSATTPNRTEMYHYFKVINNLDNREIVFKVFGKSIRDNIVAAINDQITELKKLMEA
ncbi:hypothetical protein GQ42DRAFT_162563 [Ramicandelaber brevisporus]|nr:hypothetical protein GQ42DRAFT_162563 [Ramicandelaber brevisporus]